MRILSINSGSSSLKFAVHELDPKGKGTAVAGGKMIRIGRPDSLFIDLESGAEESFRQVPLPDHKAALESLVRYLREQEIKETIQGIGHRLVHGGPVYQSPRIVTADTFTGLRDLIHLAPEHMPEQLMAVEFFGRLFPATRQVACFDTSFHKQMPRVARIFPLPGRLEKAGVVRYGFHGLSCESILHKLMEEKHGLMPARMVIAHLGNGASMTAVKSSRSVDTTMGFTPAGGLMMSTRSGDLDPGVIFYLLREQEIGTEKLAEIINSQSGLLGVSGISGDMEQLLKEEQRQPGAADAVALFCYQARKYLGSLVFALGGIDLLAFTGGIGEKSPAIRERICADLGFAGITLSGDLNGRNAGTVSAPGAPVEVRVIETDEELMIALHTAKLLEE
ncbi:MAG: acetate/propionate family kinase [Thermoleophilia bacterium]|nr:acetate/propionate family kinase [Thermoleophilia bacterium]